ncbi:hypothetical protein GUG51_25560, partial [Xanthomonas citri pv. citri]|nr:hypothetical protein [Xanthomonas citri pv. citri]
MTIIHADNTDNYYSTGTDLYPYQKKDSLTAASRPTPKLNHPNTDNTTDPKWS